MSVRAVDVATGDQNSTGPLVISLTVSNTQDRVLLVGAGSVNSVTISRMLFGDQEMTRIHRQAGGYNIWCDQWYLLSPRIGTDDIRIYYSGTIGISAGAIVYSGVDLDDPFGTNVYANGYPGPATVNATGVEGGMVSDVALGRLTTLTVGAGQTQRYNITPQGGDTGGSDEIGTGTVTMSWTLGSSMHWVITATPLKPSHRIQKGIRRLRSPGRIGRLDV